MKNLYTFLLIIFAFITNAQSQNQLDEIILKNGQKLDIKTVTFKSRCGIDECRTIGDRSIRPKFKPRDICVYAICKPLDAARIKLVLPKDAEHWRIYPNNTMQLFKGDTPLLAQPVPATAPLVDADRSQVQHSPILVQADLNGMPVKYWVRVLK